MFRIIWLSLSIVLCCSIAAVAQIPTTSGQSAESFVQDCGQEAHWDPKIQRCKRNVPLSSPQGKLLSPPLGVIVLHPGGVREQADSCPTGFEEKAAAGWRFCVDSKNPEEIPPLMIPPVAGIPYETVKEITARHTAELLKLPGVTTIMLGADGIIVETDNPSIVPQSVEGVPVKTQPSQKRRFLNHSQNSPLNPVNGGVVTSDSNAKGSGTLTGVVLSQGKPWLVTAAHLISRPLNSNPNPPGLCSIDSTTCPPPSGTPPALGASILNSCPHNSTQDQLFQPSWFASNRRSIGYVPRWSKNDGFVFHPTADVAAAFMDDNTIRMGWVFECKQRDLHFSSTYSS